MKWALFYTECTDRGVISQSLNTASVALDTHKPKFIYQALLIGTSMYQHYLVKTG